VLEKQRDILRKIFLHDLPSCYYMLYLKRRWGT